MEKDIRQSPIVSAKYIGALAGLLVVVTMLFPPVGVAILCPSVRAALLCLPPGTLGSYYRKAGETVFTIDGVSQPLAIYKARNRPFLLVGPCRFPDTGDEDFFFVSQTQVIRTALDKGGDMWFRFLNHLYIVDDLSNSWNLMRAPFWDELKRSSSEVQYDKTTESFVFAFHIDIDDDSTIPVSFTIPERLFTPDMLNAPNATKNW